MILKLFTNKYLSILLLFLFYNNIIAQTTPQFAQYRDGLQPFNPATTGFKVFDRSYRSNNDFDWGLGSSIRWQWAEVEDSPATQLLWGEKYLAGLNTGVGFTFVNDVSGRVSNSGLYVNGAYHLLVAAPNEKIRQAHYLSIGLSFGMVQHRINTVGISGVDLNDPNLIAADFRHYYPDANIGLFYYCDKIYAGISMSQVMGLELRFEEGDRQMVIEQSPRYQALAGIYLDLGEKGTYLEPSARWSTGKQSLYSVDANVKFQYRHIGWIGVGGTLGENDVNKTQSLKNQQWLAEVGLQLKKRFKLSYLIRGNLGNETPSFGLQHEVAFGYGLLR